MWPTILAACAGACKVEDLVDTLQHYLKLLNTNIVFNRPLPILARTQNKKTIELSRKLRNHLSGWGKDMIRRTGGSIYLLVKFAVPRNFFALSRSSPTLNMAGLSRSLEFLREPFPVMSDCCFGCI